MESALEYDKCATPRSASRTGAALLESNILYQLGRHDEAIKRIETALEYQPESLRLGLQYARLLTQSDLEKSQAQFERLVNKAPKDRKSTRLNSSHVANSYAVFCLKKKKITKIASAE